MKFWPRKPEPVLNWRLVKFVSFCVDCDAEVITDVPMLCAICAECQAARKAVDTLSWAEIDHYGEFLVSQGVESVEDEG